MAAALRSGLTQSVAAIEEAGAAAESFQSVSLEAAAGASMQRHSGPVRACEEHAQGATSAMRAAASAEGQSMEDSAAARCRGRRRLSERRIRAAAMSSERQTRSSAHDRLEHRGGTTQRATEWQHDQPPESDSGSEQPRPERH